MIKIAINVRNRLSVTKKAIEALYRHTTNDFQLYIYDNRTNYKTKEHFEFFWKLYEDGMIHQITFNTKESVFNAFDKAAALNCFGHNHTQDPKKKEYDFLLFLDNDMIVMPNWDNTIINAWNYVKKRKLSNIKVIVQYPGGIKNINPQEHRIDSKITAITGKLSGSGFWSVKPDFYQDVGFLDLKPLVGLSKKHDQQYWKLLSKKNTDYIMAVKSNMVLHTGSIAGSICNVIGFGTNDKKEKEIQFRQQEERIDNMSFDEFYNLSLKQCIVLDK